MAKKLLSKLASITMLSTIGFLPMKIGAQELKRWTEIEENSPKIFIENYNFENKGYITHYQEFISYDGHHLKNILDVKFPNGMKIKIWDYNSDSIIDVCTVTDKDGEVIGHYFKDKDKTAIGIAQKNYNRSMKKIQELLKKNQEDNNP